MAFYFGVDLGTTNSVIAVAASDNTDTEIKKVTVLDTKRIVALSPGDTRPETASKPTLPSCVFYREKRESGGFEPIVGEFAKSYYEVRPEFVAKSVKSQMGMPALMNMSSAIPDHTPEDVSARILEALFKSIKSTHRYEVHDAVITVPASFGITQREATIRAAQKAGICVRNSDGTLREFLLSEPEAVIYNLINEMKDNPLISDFMLDSSKKLNMLVFDIGGGTLDITFHQVERSDLNSEHYTVNNVATNRYTHLAGDTFDRAVAEVMFQRYLESVIPEARGEILSNKEVFISKLMSTAELLKMDINTAVGSEDDDLWGYGEDDVEDRIFDVSGLSREKYRYYDKFKKCDIEDILKPYMGYEFSYKDYKNAGDIALAGKDRNIIYPVLYVLDQAARTLGEENLKVDAVVLNGGMSKFYMIKDRIRDFFEMEPMCVTDPDLSVARGAAIYRFYKRNEMPLAKEATPDTDVPAVPQRPAIHELPKPAEAVSGIYSGTIRNNQPLYVSSTYGNKIPIIDVGAELPYSTEKMCGFTIAKNQTKIRIPICEKDDRGNYRIIAVGEGVCQKVSSETYVSVVFHLNRNKIMTFTGERSVDKEGKVIIENISIQINFNTETRSNKRRDRLQVPEGSHINVNDSINNLEKQFTKSLSKRSESVKQLKKQIIGCENKADFAVPLLELIKETSNYELLTVLIVISRRICSYWTLAQRERLLKLCTDNINNYNKLRKMNFANVKGARISSINESIYTVGALSNNPDIPAIDELKDIGAFHQACLYSLAKGQVQTKWIVKELEKAVKTDKQIPQTVWASGVALRRTEKAESCNIDKVINLIFNVIQMDNKDTLNVAVTTAGLICDQRESAVNRVSAEYAEKAYELIKEYEYKLEGTPSYTTACKLLKGDTLTSNDEEYLLGYINDMGNSD